MVSKLKNEFISQIKKLRRVEGNKLIKKIEAFISIYQLSPVDFDYFFYKSFATFECFVEGFEAKVKEIEDEYNRLSDFPSELTRSENGTPNNDRIDAEGSSGIRFIN